MTESVDDLSGDEIVAQQDVDSVISAEEERETALPVLQISFGCALASLMDDGNVVLRENAKLPYSAIATSAKARGFLTARGLEVDTDPSELDAVMQREAHGVFVPAGSCIVMGKASVGKTPVLKWAVRKCNSVEHGSAVILRYGEPFPGYMTSEVEAASALLNALLDPEVKLIAVDSIKDLLASMDGAAMARGVPRTAFRMISQWGSVAAALGKSIMTPLNISTDNDDALNEVAAAVLSNSTCSVISTANSKFDVLARTGEGRMRDESEWHLTFEDGSPIVTETAVNLRSSGAVKTAQATLGSSSLKATQNSVLRAAGRMLSNPDHTR